MAAARAWRTAKLRADRPEATDVDREIREQRNREYRRAYAEARRFLTANGTPEQMRQLRGFRPPPRSSWEGFVRWLGFE